MTKADLVRKYYLLTELVNRLQVRLAFAPNDSVASLQCELAKADEAQTWALVLASSDA